MFGNSHPSLTRRVGMQLKLQRRNRLRHFTKKTGEQGISMFSDGHPSLTRFEVAHFVLLVTRNVSEGKLYEIPSVFQEYPSLTRRVRKSSELQKLAATQHVNCATSKLTRRVRMQLKLRRRNSLRHFTKKAVSRRACIFMGKTMLAEHQNLRFWLCMD